MVTEAEVGVVYFEDGGRNHGKEGRRPLKLEKATKQILPLNFPEGM